MLFTTLAMLLAASDPYVGDGHHGTPLPGPDWVAQPAIPGKHSTRITIAQTGPTNADRELRVEGERGFWSKRLGDAAWKFTSTGVSASLPFVSGDPVLGPSRDTVLLAKHPWPGTRISLEDWNPACDPAVLHVEAGSETLMLALPFHDGLELGGKYEGALLLPPGKSPWLTKLKVLSLGKPYLDVELEVTRDEVHLVKLPLIDLRFSR